MRLRLILLAACLCLTGLAFSYLMIRRAQGRNERLAARLAGAVGLHGDPADEPQRPAIQLSTSSVTRSPVAMLAGFFGADLAKTELYPLPWWLVPIITLVLARLVALLGQYLVGPVGLLDMPLVCVFLSRKYFKSRHQRRVTTLFQQFPEALAMIVRAVRVGLPITEAIRVVAVEAAAPTCLEFTRLADDVAIGSPLDEALRNMAARNGVPEYRFFATALSLQAQTGGGISETLENLADVIRKRVAARARGKALASEARTSALVLGVLPVLALAGLTAINPGYMSVLYFTPTGNGILACAALLLTLGGYIMRLLIQKSLS